jgi:hypothetical protein
VKRAQAGRGRARDQVCRRVIGVWIVFPRCEDRASTGLLANAAKRGNDSLKPWAARWRGRISLAKKGDPFRRDAQSGRGGKRLSLANDTKSIGWISA